jgi:MFS family permease
MLRAVLDVWALFFGLSLLMLGIGLQGTLLGLRATLEGFDATVIGAVMSSYFVGFLFGSWATPRFVRRVGHIRVFAALASLTSTTALLHALQVEPVSWAMLRFVTGMAMAGLYVICESWLNHGSTNETRGRILSIYTIISYAFFGAGQLLLNLGDPTGFTLFILISVLMSLSLEPRRSASSAASAPASPRAPSSASPPSTRR